MNTKTVYRFSPLCVVRRNRHSRAFSLVELLTVMFIISALIAILVPSLNAARNSAKKTATIAAINSIKSGLEMFRGDNERQFARTNGYPPSFAHPRMVDSSGNDIFEAHEGRFPFIEDKPVVSGAHWLPAMLMGVDQNGYIQGKTVTKRENLRYEPWKWYTPDPLGDDTTLDRAGFYADPGGLKTVQTQNLPGRPNTTLFDNGPWEIVRQLPVIVDSFGQPFLYYVANANGRPTNMVGEKRNKENKYVGGPQEQGPPYYFHEDNLQFTGTEDDAGWDFDGPHKIARAGDEFTADQLVDQSIAEARESFARFIVDRTLYRTMLKKATQESEPPSKKATLRPVNADSYLLISAGVDGIYGTLDDVTNFPRAVE